MHIPFSRPWIDDAVIAEMHDCLTHTGWLTSGPKVQALEAALCTFTGAPAAVCVNSWTSGAMLVLRWLGVGRGDEVIVPAYTYAATALCAMNLGATVKMVDVGSDFNLDVNQLKAAITPRTKAIIPVDIGGWMAHYEAIFQLVQSPEIQALYQAQHPVQKRLGRILVLADAAHSLGAMYQGRASGVCADCTVFSFHSVKNITTGEGGAVCLHLPDTFETDAVYRELKVLSLNGQTKSAFEKNQVGGWRYDIVAQGLKVNMPDVCAAIGLAQLRQYREKLLPDRKALFERYVQQFSPYPWAILPPFESVDHQSMSSAHLFMLRIKGIEEWQRDGIMETIAQNGIGANVHYQPLPMLSLFREMGYRIADFPVALGLYEQEITLPLYNGLGMEQIDLVAKTVIEAVQFFYHDF
jgi:dTDP-4-amino-4,6-dideoxygalactose transaminase